MTKLITKDMADVCEEAHDLTEKECKRLKIKFESVKRTLGYVEIKYTAKAQEIFNRYYDELTNKYNI